MSASPKRSPVPSRQRTSRPPLMIPFLGLFLVLTVAYYRSALPIWPGGGGSLRQDDGGDTSIGGPTAKVRNGTLVGVHSAAYAQDFFLGIRYAKAPVREQRFRAPKHLDRSFNGPRNAKAYGAHCPGFGPEHLKFSVAEDCLYLNVIAPQVPDAEGKLTSERKGLPVGVWIHGGGFLSGGTADPRYNLSFIVENSYRMGKPMIGVSINHRLWAWGFLASEEVMKSGHTNLGLRDQNMALRWVQENIAAFGGDPGKVTLFGVSAGASSIGFQMVAHGGRDDKLFRGAIMESGSPYPLRPLLNASIQEPSYQTLLKKTSCRNLSCLREVPFQKLNLALSELDYTTWHPIIDGTFVTKHPAKLMASGNFIHVPVIIGANSDEGTKFSPRGLNTEAEFRDFVKRRTRRVDVVSKVADAYPNDECFGTPASFGCERPASKPWGKQWRRVTAFVGDFVFVAHRRLSCAKFAAAGVPTYCYRFNVTPTGNAREIGSAHFAEVAFALHNTLGVGYDVSPFKGEGDRYKVISWLMSRSWVSFIVDQDPNSFREWDTGRKLPEAWPQYGDGKTGKLMLFDAPEKGKDAEDWACKVEDDDFRAEGIGLINRELT